MTSDGSVDRRHFFAMAGGTSLALSRQAEARKALRRSPIIINSLGGIDDPNITLPEGSRDVAALTPRAIRDAHASGLTAVNLTLGYVMGDGDPFETTVREIAWWDEAIRERRKDLIKVRAAADIVAARRSNRIGVIYGFQNSVMMGDKLERVETFADLGVRIVQLTYNDRNTVGCGSIVPDNCGLSDFGHALVERLNARHLVVDLSHSGQQLCLDAARFSQAPICISHTGCRALCDLPRNKSDEELRLVAERGGYVGIYFMLYLNPAGRATADDVVRHILHAVNVCGEDHVGIGTDGTITTYDDMAAYKEALRKEVEQRKALGVSAPGEAPDRVPFVMDLRGPSQFRDLARLLKDRGFTERRIEKILGLNFLAYCRSVWKA
jgi:membrane dipeptidase